MTPSEHWDHINPRHPSDSLRGWHFPKDEPKISRRRVYALLAWVAFGLAVGAIVFLGVTK